MTEPSGGSDKAKRPVAVPVIGLVALTAIGITVLLGGLDERPDSPPPQLKPGDSLDQGQFETQFVESKLTVERAKSPFTDDKRFVDVVFKVTNKTDETISVGSLPYDKSRGYSFGGSLLKMDPPIKSKYGPRMFVDSKGVESVQLHPAVPATVIARFELEGAARPPEQVTFDVGVYEKAENPLTGESLWLLPTEGGFLGKAETKEVAAKVTLPVKPEGA
ncbi:hypothetical protein [Nonomuraea sp. LPB2021202275-12-8]|uniref:hypothetical protein n=1 Tax=Nonomuraea sp. LPB2021202275-12-8 TaxID=3120159 RepID=UPI00300D04E3